ncbi:uncharacterized protein LOC129749963 [Uranotaenia lowii]|uniref:uncharacterized protein LOC129744654 n=1 Tax=Uranotaenia lowii TaxID=190385 RepID=UPI00247AE008|nr:uncharacterized protein LOC129744654 [Uranotaenia lowii]XP_055601093.1 uncharacterized protein LOC129749963 [Uranotaenia lowii]
MWKSDGIWTFYRPFFKNQHNSNVFEKSGRSLKIRTNPEKSGHLAPLTETRVKEQENFKKKNFPPPNQTLFLPKFWISSESIWKCSITDHKIKVRTMSDDETFKATPAFSKRNRMLLAELPSLADPSEHHAGAGGCSGNSERHSVMEHIIHSRLKFLQTGTVWSVSAEQVRLSPRKAIKCS